MKVAEIQLKKTYHNGKEGEDCRLRYTINWDNANGVTYRDNRTGRIGNCSVDNFAKWAKGELKG
ncbi:hypothetical protein KP806_07320 [Paenibacillus sp. N4]|uniref:hypothetical protein n=1 Tax=Paenibacillus vietnamensis TaxID=2590547 RepID=UPI001CD18066|nr:hypothetical protein [Paenibacillus vietnamensis]MCA0754856.1 hypothetical protein [Paenibacillus vietnamensis]